ncbi:major facilitator superfamily domain-containing protein [Aspergillus unguis]
MSRRQSEQESSIEKVATPTVSLQDEGTAVVQHEENVQSKHLQLPGVPQAQLKKAIRKVDFLVLPIMTVMLAFSYIDRSNMGLANVAGMSSELKFEGYDYSISLLVFFPGYALAVFPSNYILNRTKVQYWLTFVCVAFGIFTLGSGLIRNQAGLFAMRVLLGMAEAGCYPTVISVICTWYPRHSVGKRMTIVGTGASLIASLSGILTYVFSRINVHNYAGWRWIFILEGTITTVIALGAFFLIDEYPEKSRFLTEEERSIIVRLISQDREEQADEKLTVRLMLHILRDFKIWVFASLYMICVVTSYGMAYFMPLILNEKMGFSGALSQVLTTPPYFYAVILAIALTWISDRHHTRTPFIVFFAVNVIVGMALTRWGPNTGSQYLGLFFTLGGSLINGPMIIVWGQNNVPTRAARSVSSGLQLTCGAIGGIIGSTVFRSQDAPLYTPGSIVVMCCAGYIIIVSTLLGLHMRKLNRLAAERQGEPAFVYTL